MPKLWATAAVLLLASCGGGSSTAERAQTDTRAVTPGSPTTVEWGWGDCTLKIFVSTEATEDQIDAVMERLRDDERVEEARFVTNDDALEEVGEESGLDEYLTANPLPHEIRVTPRDATDAEALVAEYDTFDLPKKQDDVPLKEGLVSTKDGLRCP